MDSSMLIWILIAVSFLTLGLLFSVWRQRREGSQASEELVQLTSSLQLANERLERRSYPNPKQPDGCVCTTVGFVAKNTF
jgi:hypothetical protein